MTNLGVFKNLSTKKHHKIEGKRGKSNFDIQTFNI